MVHISYKRSPTDNTMDHSPRHPTLNVLTRQNVQTIVDVAGATLKDTIDAKFDAKLHESVKDTISRAELMIRNSSLEAKDGLRNELRNLEERMRSEMKKEMDEMLLPMKTQLNKNTMTLDEVKGAVSRLKSDMSELSERVDREQRLVEQRFHKDEDTSQNTVGSLENLKKNVKELFAEYNDRH